MSDFDHKKYYAANKDKMKGQILASQRKARIRKLVEKLNEDGYKRTPYSKIIKYGIIYDEDKNKYFIN